MNIKYVFPTSIKQPHIEIFVGIEKKKNRMSLCCNCSIRAYFCWGGRKNTYIHPSIHPYLQNQHFFIHLRTGRCLSALWHVTACLAHCMYNNSTLYTWHCWIQKEYTSHRLNPELVHEIAHVRRHYGGRPGLRAPILEHGVLGDHHIILKITRER